MKNNYLYLLALLLGLTMNAQRANPLQTFNPDSVDQVTCEGVPTSGDLVVNGNFEQNSGIPTGLHQITLACGWSSPTNGSPDYFHRDSSSGLVGIPDHVFGPREVNPTQGGDAYAGIGYNLSIREMIRTKLLEPLEPLTEYTLEFDVSVSPSFGDGAVIKFQAYLGPYIQGNTANDLPIDPSAGGIFLENSTPTTNTTGWDTISFTFTTGLSFGQEYLYIGAISDVEITGGGLGYNFIDNVSLKPTVQYDCGTCTDTAGNFPVVSNPFSLSNNFLTKAITSDCNGNIYSVGDINGTVVLNKYDLNGTLLWSQNTIIAYPFHYVKSMEIEVDESENIYIKHHDDFYKYDSNGNLSWHLWAINDYFDIEKTGTFAINKQTGDTYIPLNTSTVIYNTNNPGSYPNYPVDFGIESTVLKVDTNGNILDLGAFSSDGILNVHFNNGLKVWYENSLGIGFREYSFDMLLNDNPTWLDDAVVSSFDNLYPLYYNHINDEVYVFTGNQATTNNNNTRILSVTHDGTAINANILLPEALHYSGMLLRANRTFNQNTGAMAIYADHYQFNGSCVISTIDTSYQLDSKTLVSNSLGLNPFYSDSYHGITYGGSCLYFYGHYESTSNITLDGGSILPPSGTNNLRSFIIRLQDDLDIEFTNSKNSIAENEIIITQNPINGNNINVKFKESNSGKINFALYDINGELILQESGFLDEKGAFNLKLQKTNYDLLFLKVMREDGYFEIKRIIIN